MAKKLYDLVVKTGEYTKADGTKKGRYLNVGVVMEGQDGKPFAMLESTFNPAGIDRKPGSSSIIVSMFEPNDKPPVATTAKDEEVPF